MNHARHLHEAGSASDLEMRIALAKGLLDHRHWCFNSSCKKNRQLVLMALDGKSIAEMQGEDEK